MNYTKTIREYCLQNPGEVFDMSYEHNKHFPMVPYRTFCKILNRLEEEGIIRTYSKGVYIINADKYKDDPIIAFYASEDTGVVVGYKMYNDLGVTEHQEKPIIIYTNAMDTSAKNIGDDYKLIHVDITFFDKRVKQLIICLELIQNRNSIKECNIIALDEILIDYLQTYEDFYLREVLSQIYYSYSTIVTLEEILNKLHIPNSAMQIALKYHKNA